MREGILISAGLHVGVVAAAIAGLPRLVDPTPPRDSPTIVEVVTIDAREVAKPEPSVPAPEPPAAQPATLEPATARPVVAPSPPKAAPKPVPPAPAAKPASPPVVPKARPRTATASAPAKPKPDARARAVTPPPPRPPPPDAFAGLLRNLGKERRHRAASLARAADSSTEPARSATPPAPRAVSKIERHQIAETLKRDVQDQVWRCWNPPIGVKHAEEMRVRVRIRLNPDGTLNGKPHIIDQDRLFRDPAFRAFAERAARALQNPRCSPLRLPLAHYRIWRDISFNFDPTELLQ